MHIKPNSYYYNNKKRNPILSEYIKSIYQYYKTIHPEVDDNKLNQIIKDIIKEKIQIPYVEINNYVSDGNINKEEVSLLGLIDSIGTNKILSVHGVAYKQEIKQKSVFTDIIEADQAERDRIKKEMIQAKIHKDEDTYNIKNFAQKDLKIAINSISGVMLKGVFFRSSKNYNAITSTVRYSIMAGYSFVEMFIAGNLFFETEDDVINIITQLLRIYPGDNVISNIINKYQFHIPTIEEVQDYYIDNLRNYLIKPNIKPIKKYIENLSNFQRVFVYYAFSLHNILKNNEKSMKNIINDFLNIDKIEIKPNVQTDLDDHSLIILIVSMVPSLLKNRSLEDALKNDEIRNMINNYYVELKNKFANIQDLFDTFVLIPFSIPKIMHHYKMLRKSTILSDTDSIIFTLINLIKWYTGDIKVNSISMKVNALFIYIITKVIEHMFAYISSMMNIDERNIRKILMKNEFFYPVFVRCHMSKHYFGYNTMQEGNIIDPPKVDIKGKNFIGSDLPSITLKFVHDTIIYILDTILKDYKLEFTKLVERIVNYEERILKSLKEGNTEFIMQKGVKEKEEYKNPLISHYFLYMLYEEVFQEKYEKIHLPQKCKFIPIYPISVKNITEIGYMEKIDKKIYDKFVSFLEKYPKKTITSICIPVGIKIPPEIQPIVDYRSVIYRNCFPIYLLYKSFGICTIGNNDKKILFIDFYKK